VHIQVPPSPQIAATSIIPVQTRRWLALPWVHSPDQCHLFDQQKMTSYCNHHQICLTPKYPYCLLAGAASYLAWHPIPRCAQWLSTSIMYHHMPTGLTGLGPTVLWMPSHRRRTSHRPSSPTQCHHWLPNHNTDAPSQFNNEGPLQPTLASWCW